MQSLHGLYTLLDGSIRHEFPSRISELRQQLQVQVFRDIAEHTVKLGYVLGVGFIDRARAASTINTSDFKQVFEWLERLAANGAEPTSTWNRASSQASAAGRGAELATQAD